MYSSGRGKKDKINKLKAPTDKSTQNSKNSCTKDSVICDSKRQKQSERLTDTAATAATTAPPQSQLKSKPKPNTVIDSVKSSCNGQVGSRLAANSLVATGKIQPLELDAAFLDTTLLNTDLHGYDDLGNNSTSIGEHIAADNTVIDHNVASFRAEIYCQRQLILKLQQQLRFVLTVLGITEQANQLTSTEESAPTKNAESCPVDMNDQTAGQMPRADGAATTQLPQVPHHLGQNKQKKLVSNFQQSLIAAVYVDQSEQKRRESSLIVSGLQESKTETDKLIFANLCKEELKAQPDIISTKRLGRVEPTKIRPLLIVTRKAEQAQHLISMAKQLRKSSNSTIRDKVFINRNLTKAEAEAAYYVRVQRRQTAMQHADHPAATSVHADDDSSRGSDYEDSNARSHKSAGLLTPVSATAPRGDPPSEGRPT